MRGVEVIILATMVLVADASEQDRVQIPGGAFQMGRSTADPDCEQDEGPVGGIAVTVPNFKIDRHEVTVAAYQRCMAAGKCSRPKDHSRNKYCNLDAPMRENHPINCVDWQQAVDYCAFTEGRLPYEAEWEKAARGGTAARFPWGQEVTCKHAILDDGVTFGSVPNEPDGCGGGSHVACG